MAQKKKKGSKPDSYWKEFLFGSPDDYDEPDTEAADEEVVYDNFSDETPNREETLKRVSFIKSKDFNEAFALLYVNGRIKAEHAEILLGILEEIKASPAEITQTQAQAQPDPAAAQAQPDPAAAQAQPDPAAAQAQAQPAPAPTPAPAAPKAPLSIKVFLNKADVTPMAFAKAKIEGARPQDFEAAGFEVKVYQHSGFESDGKLKGTGVETADEFMRFVAFQDIWPPKM